MRRYSSLFKINPSGSTLGVGFDTYQDHKLNQCLQCLNIERDEKRRSFFQELYCQNSNQEGHVSFEGIYTCFFIHINVQSAD